MRKGSFDQHIPRRAFWVGSSSSLTSASVLCETIDTSLHFVVVVRKKRKKKDTDDVTMMSFLHFVVFFSSKSFLSFFL